MTHVFPPMSRHWRACSIQWNDVPTVYGQSIANAREGCQAYKSLSECCLSLNSIGIDPPGSCNMTFSYLCFRSTVTLTTHIGGAFRLWQCKWTKRSL